ncbi:arginine ABC transporter permease ArtQ, partial [Vibrio parahaemolyticus]|nr:arginine ABC transporter permease ArtQ [Vibrio parahaemolyticus]
MLDLQGYEASILKGALVTIEVYVMSLILAVICGNLGAISKLSPYKCERA